MRNVRNLSKLGYLVAIVLLVGLPAATGFAQSNRYSGNGLPADMMEQFQITQQMLVETQEMVAEAQALVGSLTTYIENETAIAGELSAEICVNAYLALLADGTVGVRGWGNVKAGTGVDVYGVLDLEANLQADAYLDVVALLEAGFDVTTSICLNAGVTNTTSAGLGAEADPVELTQSWIALAADTRVVMQDLALSTLPNALEGLPISPEHLLSGVAALEDAVDTSTDFAVDTMFNPTVWQDMIMGLPGYDALVDRFGGIEDAFDDLKDGDVCSFVAGISGPAGDFARELCEAVPAGIDTSLAFAQEAVDEVWGVIQNIKEIEDLARNVIDPALDGIMTAVNGVRGVVDWIGGVVGGIDSVVDAICSKVPGC